MDKKTENTSSAIDVDVSLHDYFAAQAMVGLLANGWCTDYREINSKTGSDEVAKDAYIMAEAMIKARKRYAEKS